MNVKEIAAGKRARKGPAYKITRDGAYWLAVDVQIDRRGGDGVGQDAPRITDRFRVRHYRDDTLRAYCETEKWHESDGVSCNWVACDRALECDTIEGLIRVIISTPYDANRDEWGYYNVYDPNRLASALPELALSLPSPDEECHIQTGISDDLPSGKRIFELTKRAIHIEKVAREFSPELFVATLCEEADFEMREMNPVEKRFFETLLRENYVKPCDRGEDWRSSLEILEGLP